MKNVVTKIEGDMLYIGVKLTDKQGPTKGGKGTVLGTTEGFRNVDSNPKLAFSLMVYERNAEKKAA